VPVARTLPHGKRAHGEVRKPLPRSPKCCETTLLRRFAALGIVALGLPGIGIAVGGRGGAGPPGVVTVCPPPPGPELGVTDVTVGAAWYVNVLAEEAVVGRRLAGIHQRPRPEAEALLACPVSSSAGGLRALGRRCQPRPGRPGRRRSPGPTAAGHSSFLWPPAATRPGASMPCTVSSPWWPRPGRG
jgi:hypothetical protein